MKVQAVLVAFFASAALASPARLADVPPAIVTSATSAVGSPTAITSAPAEKSTSAPAASPSTGGSSSAAAPSATPVAGSSSVCGTGLYSNAQCCSTDVLGVADLDCKNPTTLPVSPSSFVSGCAAVGQRARCCVIPVASQGVLCNAPVGTPS